LNIPRRSFFLLSPSSPKQLPIKRVEEVSPPCHKKLSQTASYRAKAIRKTTGWKPALKNPGRDALFEVKKQRARPLSSELSLRYLFGKVHPKRKLERTADESE
jgi:hypothetical protein